MTDSLHQLLGAVRAGEGRAASTRGQGIAALVLATLTILATLLINSAYRSREQSCQRNLVEFSQYSEKTH